MSSENNLVSVRILREYGELILTIDPTGLHKYIKSLGLEVHRAKPTEWVNKETLKLDYRVLLLVTNGFYQPSPVPCITRISLTHIFERPLSNQEIRRIIESISEAVDAVILHHTPIDVALDFVNLGA